MTGRKGEREKGRKGDGRRETGEAGRVFVVFI